MEKLWLNNCTINRLHVSRMTNMTSFLFVIISFLISGSTPKSLLHPKSRLLVPISLSDEKEDPKNTHPIANVEIIKTCLLGTNGLLYGCKSNNHVVPDIPNSPSGNSPVSNLPVVGSTVQQLPVGSIASNPAQVIPNAGSIAQSIPVGSISQAVPSGTPVLQNTPVGSIASNPAQVIPSGTSVVQNTPVSSVASNPLQAVPVPLDSTLQNVPLGSATPTQFVSGAESTLKNTPVGSVSPNLAQVVPGARSNFQGVHKDFTSNQKHSNLNSGSSNNFLKRSQQNNSGLTVYSMLDKIDPHTLMLLQHEMQKQSSAEIHATNSVIKKSGRILKENSKNS